MDTSIISRFSRREAGVSSGERGSIMILGLAFILVLLLMSAMVLDIHRAYVLDRRSEEIAKALALAGAEQLNGTRSGVDNSFDSPTSDAIPDAAKAIESMAALYGVDIADVTHEAVFYSEEEKAVKGAAFSGVPNQVWANAVRVIVRQTHPTLLVNPLLALLGLGNMGNINVRAVAVAVAHSPVETCVAPFAIPLCGLTYEQANPSATPPTPPATMPVGAPPAPGERLSQGDIATRNSLMRQEILFGPVGVPDGVRTIPYPYPKQFLDGASVKYELSAPNNSDSTRGWFLSDDPIYPEERVNYPDLQGGVVGRTEDEATGLPVYDKRLHPLRGAFAVPSRAKAGADATRTDVLAVLNSTWPGGGAKGCVTARVGERVFLLDGPEAQSRQFETAFGMNNNAMKANKAVADLIFSNTPAKLHGLMETVVPPSKEQTIDPPEEIAYADAACDVLPDGVSGTWQYAEYPNGRAGCHTFGAIGGGGSLGCGLHDPYGIAPAGVPADCDSSPVEIPDQTIDHPIWKTMAMVVASANGKNYCPPDNDPFVTASSDPTIIGFIPIWVFDTQIYKPDQCTVFYRDLSGNLQSQQVAQDSCRGVRAKPVGRLLYHHGYQESVRYARLVTP